MGISKPLYQAAMYIKSGHPAYRRPWQEWVQTVAKMDEPTFQTVAATAGVTTAVLTRHVIRSLNGLDPHANSRPRSTTPTTPAPTL